MPWKESSVMEERLRLISRDVRLRFGFLDHFQRASLVPGAENTT